MSDNVTYRERLVRLEMEYFNLAALAAKEMGLTEDDLTNSLDVYYEGFPELSGAVLNAWYNLDDSTAD
jgi:hypothetical protein